MGLINDGDKVEIQKKQQELMKANMVLHQKTIDERKRLKENANIAIFFWLIKTNSVRLSSLEELKPSDKSISLFLFPNIFHLQKKQ